MDYHSHRFSDHSIIFTHKDKTVGLLPANLSADGTLYSHQGLTYGGLIIPPKHINGEDVMAMMDLLINHCRENGIDRLIYKALPHIYSRQPAEDDLYALWCRGAEPLKVELSSAIRLAANPGPNTDTRRRTRKAFALNPVIEETRDVIPFWNLLRDTLAERHNTSPVHSADELQLLMDRFPSNIRVHTLSLGGTLMAGICVYDTGQVAHAQYTASSPRARELSMVFALYSHLINKVYADRLYFDFGISNEDAGHYLNTGLLRQKSSFGATGLAHLTLQLNIQQHSIK